MAQAQVQAQAQARTGRVGRGPAHTAGQPSDSAYLRGRQRAVNGPLDASGPCSWVTHTPVRIAYRCCECW